MAEEKDKTPKVVLIDEPPPKMPEFHISRIKEDPIIVIQNLEKEKKKSAKRPP